MKSLRRAALNIIFTLSMNDVPVDNQPRSQSCSGRDREPHLWSLTLPVPPLRLDALLHSTLSTQPADFKQHLLPQKLKAPWGHGSKYFTRVLSLEVDKLADFNEIMSFRMHREDAYKKKRTGDFSSSQTIESIRLRLII